MEECKVLVTNSRADKSISSALVPFGYTIDRLQWGVDLCAETIELFRTQEKEYTDQYYATNEFLNAFELTRKTASSIGKIARIAFKNNIEGQRLIPNILNNRAYSEWNASTTALYSGILASEKLLTLMSEFGINNEILTAEMNNIKTLEALNQKKYIEEGEAQIATQNRNRKLELLQVFCSDLRTIARIALKDQPQQLEKLGILVRSSYPRKSIAPAEKETIK